jgi:hypothetical protein
MAIAAVMLGGALLPAAAPSPHPALARGLELMREGDFEAAVLELDAAVRRIEADPAAQAHRAWAYVYLGVAYLELEQEGVARGKFREALARNPGLRLVPSEFSAQSIRVFEGERAQVAAAPPPAPAAPRPTPRASVAPAGKRSKGPLVAVIVGGVAAAGAAVALGGGGGGGTGGGGGGATTPPSTLPGETTTTTTTTTTITSPTTSTTTTTVPTTPTTTQPPGPPPPSCAYNVAGQVNVSLAGCIGCTCSVSATAGCAWTARTSDPAMITITQGAGTGDGRVTFNVGLSATPRTGRITLNQGGGTCTVSQGTLVAGYDHGARVTGDR